MTLQVGHAGGAPRLVTASADGTIAVCGGAAKGSRMAPGGGGVLQRLQVRRMSWEDQGLYFCLAFFAEFTKLTRQFH